MANRARRRYHRFFFFTCHSLNLCVWLFNFIDVADHSHLSRSIGCVLTNDNVMLLKCLAWYTYMLFIILSISVHFIAPRFDCGKMV